MVLFTVDFEPWDAFKPHEYWDKKDPNLREVTSYLLDLLRRHQIKAIFYLVGWLGEYYGDLCYKIKKEGHVIGDHTYYHKLDAHRTIGIPFRAPRWKGEKRLFSGGFWLRLLPYWLLKNLVLNTGIFFVHPHDVMLEHPKCGSWYQDLKRNIGLKTARDKLERLCRELEWQEASRLQRS